MEKMGTVGAGTAGSVAQLAVAGAAGLTASIGLKALSDAVMTAVRSVSQFTVSMVSAAQGAAQIPQALGSASAQIGETVETFGKYAVGAGVALAFLNPVVGAAVVAFGAILYESGLLGKILGELGKSFGALIQEIEGHVQRYGEFNPQIALAQAQSEMIGMMNDIRRAQEIAPDLVRYIKARTDLEQKYEDMKIRILQQLMPLVTAGMGGIEAVLPLVEQLITIGRLILENTPGLNILVVLQRIKEALEAQQEENFDPLEIIRQQEGIKDLDIGVYTPAERAEVPGLPG
jgi:hypothetical protein